MLNKLVWALLLLASIVVAGCGGGGTSSGSSGGSIAVTPSDISVAPGQHVTFGATVTGLSASTVTWTAQNGTITSAGFYTAPSTIGSDVVTATSTVDSSVTGSATVTISNSGSGVVVTIHPINPSVTVGSSQQFTASVTGTTNQAVTWNATGGTIDSNGLYTAPTLAGNYVISARSAADPSRSGTTIVKVTASSTRVIITPPSVNLSSGQSQKFTATVNGNANTAIIWSTTGGGTIDQSGNYTAPQAAGTYTVTATSSADSTQSATAVVTVTAVTIQISPSNAKILTGQQQQFTATVSGATDTSATWTTSGGSVSSTGLYTAPGTAGTYTVTATSTADSVRSATATVVVVSPLVYQNDFTGTVGSEWSTTTTSVTPSGAHFLGKFGASDSDTLTLSSLPTHSSVTVTFQLYVIQAWQGDAPSSPDLWKFLSDSNTILSTTFSNTTGDLQAYPNPYPTGSESSPGTGASAINTLGYATFTGAALHDAVYNLSFTYPQSSSSMVLNFAGMLNGTSATESWGLANFSVTLHP